MNPNDPLENLGGEDAMSGEIPPAPEDYEFEHPLVSRRSEEDLEGFGLNMVDDYRDFKHELLSWLAHYGKNPEKHEGWQVRRSNPHTTNSKLRSAGYGSTRTSTRQSSRPNTQTSSFTSSTSQTG